MTMIRTAVTGSLVASLLLASGGCRRFQQRQDDARAQETRQQEPARAQERPAEPRTTVIDDRPSARYLVTERPSVRPQGEDREPALTPEDLASPAPGAGTREGSSLERAREFRAMGDIRSALAELERAIAFNPRFTPALLEAGDLHFELGEIAMAERSFAAAARTEPRNFDAQFRHAGVLHQLGRMDEAVRAYLRALAVRPNEYDAMLGLSTAYLEARNPEQALPYAQRATRSRPRSGEARMHLGNTLAALNRHEEAVVEYRQAAELLPRPAPGLLLNMAESFNQLGRYAEMVGALTEVVAAEPSPVAYERLGSGLFRLRRYDESLRAFARAVEMDPTYAPALNGVAVCELNNYLWSGKSDGAARERAVEAMRASIRIDRSQPRIVELLRRYSQPAPEERVRDRP
ncbi:MAG: tetratricopeptide repeat protein [Planctomycetes bacterium]|nr:tetratricopeptide repeat protein [Planctomycetota bacterium]